MNQMDRAPHLTFRTKTEADEFLKKLSKMAYNVGWVTVNDILRERKEPVAAGGGDYGYSKKDLKKVKPEKNGDCWQVHFDVPGKLVRDDHGYWVIDNVQVLEKLTKEE